jgi:hypothetical protein
MDSIWTPEILSICGICRTYNGEFHLHSSLNIYSRIIKLKLYEATWVKCEQGAARKKRTE